MRLIYLFLVALALLVLAIGLFVRPNDVASLAAEVLFPTEVERPIYNAKFNIPVAVEVYSHSSRKEILQNLNYMNQVIGTEVLVAASSDTDAEIFVIHQEENDGTFPKAFRDLYLRKFGQEKAEKAESLGYFSLDSTNSNPCFSAGIYDLDDDDFSKGRRFTVINITAKHNNSTLLKGCVLEELAHAVFGVSDRDIGESERSIFNSNVARSYLSDFSEYDLIALRFVLSGSGNGEENRHELTTKIREFIEETRD